jgi:hypothetical protein
MALAAPSIDDLFGGLPAEQRVERFEAYKSALSAVHSNTLTAHRRGELSFSPTTGVTKTASVATRTEEALTDLSKVVSGDQLAAVTSALAGIQDVSKNISLTSPLNNTISGISGLVPYDLDPVLSLLIPKELYLRNSTARIKAQGQALEFRRITGLSNAGVGGVANLSSFFNSNSASTSFNGVTLNRPTQIVYAADKIVKSFVEQGLSDSVALQAEFAGQGYTDLRQLSHTSLIWSHFLAEERNMMNSCSTPVASSAQIAALTFTAAPDATGTGITVGTSSTVCQVTLSSAYGESAPFAAGTITTVSGQGVKVTYTGAIPAGVVGINIYATTSTPATFKASTPSTASGVTGLAFASSAAAASGDNSYNTYAAGANSGTGYDGFVNTFLTLGGYQSALNGTIASQATADDFLQAAFVSLFNSTMGDPDVVITTAAVRRALAKAIQTSASTSSYRLNYETGKDGIVLGSLVQAVQNQATGKMVDLVTHRFAPAGVALIHTKQLPFPDSGVAQTVEAHNVVDSMIIEWPQIGFSYDISSYTYGALAFRAPAWSGVVTGITG